MVDFKRLNTPEGRKEMEERTQKRREESRLKEELEKKTICFTGHRPNKLGNCYSLKDPQSIYIKDKLTPILIDLVEDEAIERFISGGAIGVDQIAFWTVQSLKKQYYPNIKNIVAVPFKNQACKWTDRQTLVWYEKMIEIADEVIYVDELAEYRVDGTNTGDYHVAKMQKRNEYMVDKSRIAIAVWDGTRGGTGNCARYVRKEGKTLYHLMPQYDFKLEVTFGMNS